MLDLVEQGEIFVIMRDGQPVAELRPVTQATGQVLATALAKLEPLDDAFASDIATAVGMLDNNVDLQWLDS